MAAAAACSSSSQLASPLFALQDLPSLHIKTREYTHIDGRWATQLPCMWMRPSLGYLLPAPLLPAHACSLPASMLCRPAGH